MITEFSEDVVPLSDMKADPGRVVGPAARARRPAFLTSRGRGVAVVQSVGDCEAVEEGRSFMRAVIAGIAGLEAGREVSLAEVGAKLGLGWPDAQGLRPPRFRSVPPGQRTTRTDFAEWRTTRAALGPSR